MAKKKPGTREYVLSLRGLPEFKTWLQDFANARKARMVDLIVEGLALLAKHHKFRKPPDR